MEQVISLISARSKELFFYSPYNFIRDFPNQKQLENCVKKNIFNFEKEEDSVIYKIEIEGYVHEFFVSNLKWDSKYFNLNTCKLQYVLYSHNDISILENAVRKFLKIISESGIYCFIEIPSEDIKLIQALSGAGFKLIETRLTYFRGNLGEFKQERFPVRKAGLEDTKNLMRVAREMRNDYDRFHADPIFSEKIADEFLATYIEESLKGFCDIVLTSNEKNIPSDSFLTAKYLKSEWEKNGINISKMVLSAVSSSTNKGWYKKLVSEMTYHLKDEGAEYIFMNTQSTNRAVINVWESLGYKLGGTTHILSYHNF